MAPMNLGPSGEQGQWELDLELATRSSGLNLGVWNQAARYH